MMGIIIKAQTKGFHLQMEVLVEQKVFQIVVMEVLEEEEELITKVAVAAVTMEEPLLTLINIIPNTRVMVLVHLPQKAQVV